MLLLDLILILGNLIRIEVFLALHSQYFLLEWFGLGALGLR